MNGSQARPQKSPAVLPRLEDLERRVTENERRIEAIDRELDRQIEVLATVLGIRVPDAPDVPEKARQEIYPWDNEA